MSNAMHDPRLPPLQWQIKMTDREHSLGYTELRVLWLSFLTAFAIVLGGGLGYLAFKALGILIGI